MGLLSLIACLNVSAELGFKMTSGICDHAIVVKQRVVAVEQENKVLRCFHTTLHPHQTCRSPRVIVVGCWAITEQHEPLR